MKQIMHAVIYDYELQSNDQITLCLKQTKYLSKNETFVYSQYYNHQSMKIHYAICKICEEAYTSYLVFK